jgi:hypothetical protein
LACGEQRAWPVPGVSDDEVTLHAPRRVPKLVVRVVGAPEKHWAEVGFVEFGKTEWRRCALPPTTPTVARRIGTRR